MKYSFILFFLLIACGAPSKKTDEPASALSPAEVLALPAAAASIKPGLHSAWVQWTADSKLQARALVVVDAQTLEKNAEQISESCPRLSEVAELKSSSQRTTSMKVRSLPSKDSPVLVCQAEVSPTTTKVTVTVAGDEAAQTVFVPKKKWNRIVVLGDTGCRLKGPGGGRPGAYQACNDLNKWPLQTVALAAAKLKPDVVIHLGDIHYREAPCPPGNTECAGAVTGYNWPAWEADFFTPMKPLLQAAPWVFVRGNHEACVRAGQGWMQFLEPRDNLQCAEQTETYSIKAGSHEWIVVDGADDKNMGPAFQKLATAKAKAPYRWLLVHRPFLTKNQDVKQPSEALLPESLKKPGALSLVMSGHIHALSLNRFADERPPEFIIGNGATGLLPNIDFLQKKPGDEFYIRNDFGFVSLEQTSVSAWTLFVHDTHGVVLQTCRLKEFRHKKTEVTCAGSESTPKS